MQTASLSSDYETDESYSYNTDGSSSGGNQGGSEPDYGDGHSEKAEKVNLCEGLKPVDKNNAGTANGIEYDTMISDSK